MTRRSRNPNKDLIIKRDNARCWLCGNAILLSLPRDHPASLTIDHIVPRARGGTNNVSNMACSHRACNEAKADKLPCEFFTGIEGLVFRDHGHSAIMLTFDSDDELMTVLNKLGHTRNKKLKNVIRNLFNSIDW